MVIHDYLTTISCDRCSGEVSVEVYVTGKRMRQLAAKTGWINIDDRDICPRCAAKLEVKTHELCSDT